MEIYIVQHTHTLDEDFEDIKFIGVYSSYQQAEEAVARLTMQPGFCEAPTGFSIDAYEIDQDNWSEGYFTEQATSLQKEIENVFQNITADIVSERALEDVIHNILRSRPGEWHNISNFTMQSLLLQKRIILLQELIKQEIGSQDAIIYCQWVCHPIDRGNVVVTFYLVETASFSQSVYYYKQKQQ